VYIEHLFASLTFFIPIDVWLAIFNGASLDDTWKIFMFYSPFFIFSGPMPSIIANYFGVTMEDGWGILDN